MVDTAINYRGGASEEILGELLQGRRDRFVLATKYTRHPRPRTIPNAAGNHRKNLRQSLETSLRRLRTDYIDIYWVHMWDRAHPGRGDHARPRRRGARRQDPLRRHFRRAGVGDRPGQHPGRVARLDAVRRPAGALQPAAPRHRARAAADGRGARPDRDRVEPAGRRGAVRQVHRRRARPAAGTRIDPDSAERAPAHVAARSQEVADDLGATPGAGRDRLDDRPARLRSARSSAPAALDQLARQPRRRRPRPARRARRPAGRGHPDSISGFPADFIRDNTPWVFGAAALEGDTTALPGR